MEESISAVIVLAELQMKAYMSISPWLDILVVVLLVALTAFFAAAEIAIISLNDNKITRQAEDGDRKAILLCKIVGEPGTFIATIRVAITLSGFMSAVYAAMRFTESLYQLTGQDMPWLRLVLAIAITLVLTYFSLVFGEMLPKRIAQAYPEKFARSVAIIIRAASVILHPFVFILTASTNIALRLLGIDPSQTDRTVTEEEIRMMVDVGRESGNIDDEESELIENIFDFNDKSVSEIMTHRTSIVSLDVDSSYDEVLETAVDEKYTRIPVYEDNIDNIIGILHIKDLLYHAAEGLTLPFSLRNMIREPYIAPESKTIDVLFRDMQRDHAQMAVVIDEYGGTAGIVTIEDLMEEIFGSIQDEYDEEEQEIVRKDENTFLIAGLTPLDEVSEAIGIDFPDDDYDTMGGLVISLLGRIPDENECPEIFYGSMKLKVTGMDDKRVSQVEVSVLSDGMLEGENSFDEKD